MHYLYSSASMKVLNVTPELMTRIKVNVLLGRESFALENCTQRSPTQGDFYKHHAQLTIDGISFTAVYYGKCKWVITILS